MIEIRQLTADDVPVMHALLTMFADAFDDQQSYSGNRPREEYLKRLLGSDSFIALAAVKGEAVVGGLAAYELKKFEQERSEMYIYDLAVALDYRRQGIATALIGKLRELAADRGAYVVFVQADTGIEDQAAIALYTRLGRRQEVLHFDIGV